ncbi:hypothetical protein KCU94_g3195, partial [Aureobasidium melanogenum]
MIYTSFCHRVLRAKRPLLVQAMFSTSIFIVEADLHDTPATHNSSSSNNSRSNNSSNNSNDATFGTDTITDTKVTKNNKAPVKTKSSHRFLFNPIPKPEPVPEPPTSETVDDALGPKPEPVPRPPTPGSCPPAAPIS